MMHNAVPPCNSGTYNTSSGLPSTYLEALHTATLAIMQQLELDALLETVAAQAGALTGAPHSFVYLVADDQSTLRLDAGTGMFRTQVGRHSAPGMEIAGEVWRSAQPLLIHSDVVWCERDPLLAAYDIAVVVGVPLCWNERVVGVFGVAQRAMERQMSDSEVLVLSWLSQCVPLALHNARVHAAAHQELAQRDRSDAALRGALREYQLMLDNVSEVFFQSNAQGRWTFLNRAWSELSGFSVAESLGTHFLRYVHPDDHASIKAFQPLAEWSTANQRHHTRLVTRDGSVRWIEVCAWRLFDATGAICGTAGTLHDITERHHAAEALRRSEAQFRAIFEHSALGIALVDLESRITEINPALQKMIGYSLADLRGRSFAAITYADDTAQNLELLRQLRAGQRESYQMEKRYLRKDGSLMWATLSASLVHGADGQPLILGMIEDITQRKQSEETIRQMAYYDALTNLPNRLLFHDRLQQAIIRARRTEGGAALLFLDLDRFKIINDTLGHHIGDLLLQAAAQRLLACVREGDTVARMGGDEFTIILPGVAHGADAADVAQRIVAELATPFQLNGHELFITPSIGISLFPTDGDDPETLFKHADTAMYRAKDRSRNTYQFYDSTMNALAYKQLELEQHLRRALERQEFEVFYQARVDAVSRRINGVEALVRWRHPERGLISPAEFIPVAEETGLIVPIGEWVLRAACTQNKAWQMQGLPRIRVAVNLSARQFQQPDLAERVAQILTETQLDPRDLELEITESMTMVHAERTMIVLGALKHMGVHLAMDDFGTGYSSLGYLKQFPIDTLKIDKSFVQNLTSDPNDAAIAEAVIALAHSLNLSVTAEGVETEDQLGFLRRHQCDEVQGYLIGRPVPATIFEQSLVAFHAGESGA